MPAREYWLYLLPRPERRPTVPIAAMPVLRHSGATPPSMRLIFASSAETVGLTCRP